VSVTKVVPGLTSTGVMMILTGGLIIGLSFVDRPDDDGAERMSTPSTLLNIFFSPSDVFRNLRRHPRWLVALLIMSCLSAVYFNLFLYRLTPEHVINYAVDKTLEMPIVQNNPDARQKVEEGRSKNIEDAKSPILKVGQGVSGFGAALFGYSFLAVIFFLFALAMGGEINFFQALSSVIYATFPVSVIRFLLNSLLLFLKNPDDIHPITGQSTLIQDNLNFLVLPADHPVLYTVLGTFSVLWFYWVWMNATGLKNAGEKITSTIAWTAALSVFFGLVVLGAVIALLFPSFFT
jgi:hypothetical protein